MTWLPMSGLFVAWLSWLLAGFKLILKFHGWICKWRNKKSTRNRNNSFHIAAYFERCNLLKYLERNCSLFSTQLHQVSLYIEQCKIPWQLRNFEPEQIWSDHTSRLQMIFESYSYWASMILMLKKMDQNWETIKKHICISSVQSLSRVQLFVTPWTAACQASLSISNSQSFLKLVFIESMMPSNLLSLCRYFLLLPSIFPSIRVLSNESVLHIRWPELEFQIHQSFKWIFRTDLL